MTPERWAKIEEIFQAPLDCASSVGSSLIEKECGNDAEICAVAENLISRHDTKNPWFCESYVDYPAFA
jgi:hypothetical protein